MKRLISLLSLLAAGALASSNDPYVPQRYNISLDSRIVSEAVSKARAFRPPSPVLSGWTAEGPDVTNITRLTEYWAHQYDWFKVQARLNAQFDYYRTTVQGNGNYSHNIPLSFIHQKSSDCDAIPLLLIHGWPSTSLEWEKVIRPLTQKTQDGPAFHVVAVDLPGYGFSPAPTAPGLGVRELGVAFDALMKQLGYSTYGLSTTDLGWFIGLWMVHDVTSSIKGHYFDFWYPFPTAADMAAYINNETTPEETALIKSINAFNNDGHGHTVYSTAQAQKPMSISLALTDSPVGYLAWYLDVNYASSDGYEKSMEDIITDGLLLWASGPYGSGRLYKYIFNTPWVLKFPRTNVPSGISEWGWGHGPFPELANVAFTPRDWVERIAPNLTFFSRHERGGHFPAFYRPDPWISDIRTFYAGIS